MRSMGRLVEEESCFRLYECFIDGTFSKAKRGGEGIGCTKASNLVKTIILVGAGACLWRSVSLPPIIMKAGSFRNS